MAPNVSNNKKSKLKTPSGSNTASMEANTSNLERLRAIREGHRRCVSNLDQELTEILQGEDKDYERLSVIRQLLDGKQESLSEMDQDIILRSNIDCFNYPSEMQNREFEQSKHANSATRGFVSNDNTTSE